MAKPIPIFRGAIGINNVVDPTRLLFDPDTGIQELAAALNVDLDDTGRPSRRKGFEAGLSQAAHSLFSWGGDYALFVTRTSLCVLEHDFSWTAIATVTEGARARYAEATSQVYYTNGHEKGIVKNRANHEWVDSDYVGPTTYRNFSDPPLGHLLEIWNGTMLIAADNVIWHSEPFAYSRFRKATNYIPFSSRITLVRGVEGGIFVSDGQGQYFLSGGDVKALGFSKKADYPAIEGTEAQIELGDIGDGSITGRGWIWATTEGICIGGPEGYFKNVTYGKLTYPTAIRGAGTVIGGRYICTLEP
jgi:hypothetical protein